MTRVLVLGGTSDIGLAIVERIASDEPTTAVLAVRASSAYRAAAQQRLEALGIDVELLDFDAADPAAHLGVIDAAFARPVDVAVVAFGLLGDAQTWRDQAATVELAQVNFTGALSVGVLLGGAFAAQGHGKIVALSSMAGEKVRRANFVYGATKAGMDAFYLQLAEALAPNVQIVVVRPGPVATKMIKGNPKKPLTTSTNKVANAVHRALQKRRTQIIRVPAIFGPLMLVYKHLPARVFRWLSMLHSD